MLPSLKMYAAKAAGFCSVVSALSQCKQACAKARVLLVPGFLNPATIGGRSMEL